MMTLEELLEKLTQLREECGKDSPVRVTVQHQHERFHYAVIDAEGFEYDEGVMIVLVRGGSEVVAKEG